MLLTKPWLGGKVQSSPSDCPASLRERPGKKKNTFRILQLQGSWGCKHSVTPRSPAAVGKTSRNTREHLEGPCASDGSMNWRQ